jgi:hypothetical protein
MANTTESEGVRMSIADAQNITGSPLIHWRPEPSLPEQKQYALVYHV